MRALPGLGLVTLLAVGCHSLGDRVAVNVADESARISALLATHDDPPPSTYRIATVPFVGGELVEPARLPWPSALDHPVYINRVAPASVAHLAGRIAAQSRIGVHVQADANEFSAGDEAAEAGQGGYSFHFEGPAHRALDELCRLSGNAWRYDGERVVVYRYQTRVWWLSAFAGTATVTAGTASSAASGGDESGAGTGSTASTAGAQNTQYASSMNVLADVGGAIEGLLSPAGTYSLSPSTGLLTVTDRPAVIDRVGAVVAEINAMLSRQVVFSVKVYTVDLEDSDAHGVDWSLLYQSLSGDYGLTTHIATDLPADTSVFTFSVLDPADAFAGSDVFIRALADQGKSARRQIASAVTLNHQPVDIHVGDDITYLASISSIAVADAGTQVTIEPGIVTNGFTMTLLPVVLDGGDELLVQFYLSLTNVREIGLIESGAFSIQTPNVDTRTLIDRARLRSGETIVLGGFDRHVFTSAKRGLFRPAAWFAGGSSRNAISRNQLVVTITPQIIPRR